MKCAYTWLAIALMTAAVPLSSDAQLLKNLVNNMKQNIAGKPATGAGKTEKPSISPADSAAAIKSFMTGTGGSGLLYQYRVVYTFKGRNGKDSISSDTLSTAVTDGHNVRTDLGMLGSRMQVLGHAGMPRYSVILYPDSKSYVFNIVDTAAINAGGSMTYQVVKVGSETVLGYNCTHSKLTIFSAGQKSGITEDIWTSTAVPGYAELKKMFLNQNITPKMMQALEAAGCDGSFVKMDMQTKTFSMDMQLITADRKTFPASMFQIPAGYTQGAPPNPFAHAIPKH
jgi:Domain of unknown function (DUF4412)